MALPHHTRTLAHHSQYPSIALSLSRLILLLVFFFFSFFFFFLFFVFNSHLLAFVHHPSILHHITLHRICCTSRVPPCWPASALLHLLHCATLAWPTTTSSSSSSQLSAEERSRRKPVLPVTYHLSHTLPPPARPRPPRSYLSALELIYPRHTHTQAAATAIAAATATHYRYRYRYRYRYLTARPAAAARCRCSSTNSKPTTRIPPRCFCCQPFPPPPPSSSSPGTPFILPLLPATSR
ncbi:hypothetical protein IWX92DRAFT_44891 [Phyllosticta citricarpa]